MEKFYELLKEYIADQGVPIYQIAKETGINRTLIQNVISGKKKFPKGRLNALLNSTYFTAEQIKNLCEAFFKEEYDEEKPAFFDYCNYCLNTKFTEDLQKNVHIGLGEYKNDATFLNSKKDILSAIYTTVNSSENSIFISDFDFNQTEINRIVYNACKSKKFNEFYHYTKYTDNEKDNVQIIFNSIAYAKEDCITYINDHKDFSLLFPEFIMCGDSTVMYDSEVENGIIIKNAELCDYIIHVNEKVRLNAKADVAVFHNAFEYMYHLDVISDKKEYSNIISFDNHNCSVGVNREIIDDIATDQIKSTAQVFQQLKAHFDLFIESSQDSIDSMVISYEGLMDFVNTGKIYDFPSGLAKNLKPKHRADILSAILKTCSNVFISNPKYTTFDEIHLNAEACKNQLLISYSKDDNNSELDLGIQVVFISENTELIESFSSYLKYTMLSEKTFTAEYSKKFIQKQIEILQAE